MQFNCSLFYFTDIPPRLIKAYDIPSSVFSLYYNIALYLALLKHKTQMYEFRVRKGSTDIYYFALYNIIVVEIH